jgi:hypothetical protein
MNPADLARLRAAEAQLAYYRRQHDRGDAAAIQRRIVEWVNSIIDGEPVEEPDTSSLPVQPMTPARAELVANIVGLVRAAIAKREAAEGQSR